MLCWIMIIKHACASVSDMFKTIFTACTWLRMFHKCHIPVIPFFCLDSRDSYGGIHYTQRNSNMWLSSFFKPTNEEQLSMLGMKKQIWMSLNVELCYVFVRCCEVNTSRPVGSVERCSPVYYIGKRSLKQLQGNNLWYHFKRVHILWSFKQWFPTSDVAAREVPNGCKIQEKNIKGKSFIIISIPLNLKCSYL